MQTWRKRCRQIGCTAALLTIVLTAVTLGTLHDRPKVLVSLHKTPQPRILIQIIARLVQDWIVIYLLLSEIYTVTATPANLQSAAFMSQPHPHEQLRQLKAAFTCRSAKSVAVAMLQNGFCISLYKYKKHAASSTLSLTYGCGPCTGT